MSLLKKRNIKVKYRAAKSSTDQQKVCSTDHNRPRFKKNNRLKTDQDRQKNRLYRIFHTLIIAHFDFEFN